MRSGAQESVAGEPFQVLREHVSEKRTPTEPEEDRNQLLKPQPPSCPKLAVMETQIEPTEEREEDCEMTDTAVKLAEKMD